MLLYPLLPAAVWEFPVHCAALADTCLLLRTLPPHLHRSLLALPQPALHHSNDLRHVARKLLTLPTVAAIALPALPAPLETTLQETLREEAVALESAAETFRDATIDMVVTAAGEALQSLGGLHRVLLS